MEGYFNARVTGEGGLCREGYLLGKRKTKVDMIRREEKCSNESIVMAYAY